jgi:hypothetical protein
MLESKIKDWDASIELLEARTKRTLNLFLLIYIIGSILVIWSYSFTWFNIKNAWMLMDFSIGVGLCLMIVAGYMLMCALQLRMYIFINHKIEMESWVRK